MRINLKRVLLSIVCAELLLFYIGLTQPDPVVRSRPVSEEANPSLYASYPPG